MVKWFNKSVECSIQLINPPKYNKYSPLDNFVNVKVSIKILEKIEKVSHISCGLSGNANAEIVTTNLPLNGLSGSGIAYDLIKESHLFFNCFDILINTNQNNQNDSNNNGKENYTLFEGDELSQSFEFEIPDTVYLPSSCERFNSIDGYFEINYDVYVEIYKIGGLFSKKPKIYTNFKLPIKFQGKKDLNLELNNKILNYGISKIFKDKIKKFYYNKENNSLIPNSMNKNHNKTKFLRQIWNDDYKDKNYINLTKSIPLKIKMSINSSIDLQIPLFNQLNLCLISDLKSIGIESNQSTEFIFNNQSTNLGLFQIKSLTIEARCKISINCKKYILKINQNEPVLKILFKNLLVDIKDFEYNKMNGIYFKNINIESLIEHSNIDLTKNLLDLLGDEILFCSGKIPNWFDNNITFKFTLEISDGISQRESYEFVTSSTPDIIMDGTDIATVNSTNNNNNNDREVTPLSPPPPTYENSKLDKQLLLN